MATIFLTQFEILENESFESNFEKSKDPIKEFSKLLLSKKNYPKSRADLPTNAKQISPNMTLKERQINMRQKVEDSAIQGITTLYHTFSDCEQLTGEQLFHIAEKLEIGKDPFSPFFINDQVVEFVANYGLSSDQLMAVVDTYGRGFQQFLVRIWALKQNVEKRAQVKLSFNQVMILSELFSRSNTPIRGSAEMGDFAQCMIDYGSGMPAFMEKHSSFFKRQGSFLLLVKYKTYAADMSLEDIEKVLGMPDPFAITTNLKVLGKEYNKDISKFNFRDVVRVWLSGDSFFSRIREINNAFIRSGDFKETVNDEIDLGTNPDKKNSVRRKAYEPMPILPNKVFLTEEQNVYFPQTNELQQYIDAPYHSVGQGFSYLCYMFSTCPLLEARVYNQDRQKDPSAPYTKLSPYFVAYHHYNDQLLAAQQAVEDGQDPSFVDGGGGTEFLDAVKKHGIVPDGEYNPPAKTQFDGASMQKLHFISYYIIPKIQKNPDMPLEEKRQLISLAFDLFHQTYLQPSAALNERAKTFADDHHLTNIADDMIPIISRTDPEGYRRDASASDKAENIRKNNVFVPFEKQRNETFMRRSNKTGSGEGNEQSLDGFNIPTADMVPCLDYMLAQNLPTEIGINTREAGSFLNREPEYRVLMLPDELAQGEESYHNLLPEAKAERRAHDFIERKTESNHSILVQGSITKNGMKRYVCYDPGFGALAGQQGVTLLSQGFVEQKVTGLTVPKEKLKEFYSTRGKEIDLERK